MARVLIRIFIWVIRREAYTNTYAVFQQAWGISNSALPTIQACIERAERDVMCGGQAESETIYKWPGEQYLYKALPAHHH